MINLKIYYKNGEDVCSESIATASVDLCSKEDCCTPCTGERTLDVSIPVGACYDVVTINGAEHLKFPVNISAKCGTSSIDISSLIDFKVIFRGREQSNKVVIENGVYKVLIDATEIATYCAQGFAIKATRDECGTDETYISNAIPYCQLTPCGNNPCVPCTSSTSSVAIDMLSICFTLNESEGKEYASLNPYIICGGEILYSKNITITIKTNTVGCNMELVKIDDTYYLKKDANCFTNSAGILELEMCYVKC
jgi:hypothetical protein